MKENVFNLQMTEGEWGDHIVLRAVVEVVGCTIKILKISGNEECWTTLEPASANASKHGMHLVLGHIGEYHYTSLRPAGSYICFNLHYILENIIGA